MSFQAEPAIPPADGLLTDGGFQLLADDGTILQPD